jgi:polyferredoxin
MNRIRRSTQLIALVLVNLGFIQILRTGIICPFFYCYGCPAAAFACPIGVLQHYVALQQFPFYAVGVLGVFGLGLGRFWCGWGCPFGLIQDFFIWIRRRPDFFKLPPVAWTKFLVLIAVLLAAWVAVDTAFCKICPAGSLFAAIPGWFVWSDLSFGKFFYIHILTLILAIAAFILVGRFWCRYLCPLGGILGIFSRISILKIKMDKDKCSKCGKCVEDCPVDLEKYEDVGRSTDCIQCGKCISACPTSALRITASLKN